MKRPVTGFRPIVAFLTVLIMVTSGMAMAVAPVLHPDKGQASLSFEERMEIRWDRLDIEKDDDSLSRTLGRQNLEDEFEVLSPYPTSENIYDIAWRPGHEEAILVGLDGLVMYWDSVYFSVVESEITSDLYAVSWHPSGNYALLGGSGGDLFRYDAGTIESIYTGTSFSFSDIDFSPFGDEALLVTWYGTAHLYSNGFVLMLETFDQITWEGVSWHPDDGTALLGGYEVVNNEYGWIWQARAFEYDSVTRGFTNLDPQVAEDSDSDIYGVDWSDSGSTALLVGWNGLILKWDGTAFGTVSYRETGATFTDVEFSARGEALIVGSWGTVWRYQSGNAEQLNSGVSDYLMGVDYDNPGNMAMMVGMNGMVVTYDSLEGEFTQITAGSSTIFNDVAWKPDWEYALMVGNQGAIFKCDGDKIEAVGSPTMENLLGIAWNPSGSRALIVGTSGTLLEYYDGGFGDPSVTQRLSGTTENLWDVAFSLNGNALLVGDSGEVRDWSGNFATKVISRTNRDLRGVDWKDSNTAYIGGAVGEVLRYRTDLVSHIDIASPSNIQVRDTIYSPLWEDDKDRGLMVASNGALLEHYEYNDATTVDDQYGYITTDTSWDLFDIAWNYDKDDALIVGDFGTALNFHDSTDNIRDLEPPTNERLNGVAWKANEYALIVGGSGTVMKYWPNLKPDAVTLSNPTDITDNSMRLSWTESGISDFHHYEVHMSESEDFIPSPYTRIKTSTVQKATNYNVVDLRRDTTYYFKVRVVDDGSLYADSNEVYGHTAVGMLPPAAVILYEPKDITSAAMILEWSRNRDTDFDHYEVHMSTDENFEISGGTIEASIDDVFETEYSVVGLTANTTYFFKVRVGDEDGLFNDSNEVNGTTEDLNRPPTAVTLNDPFNITDDTLEMNWTRNEDADFLRYEIHYSTEDGFNLTAGTKEASFDHRNDTAYKFEGLEPDTEYFFVARIFDTGGLSSDSNQVNATTLEYNPPPEAVELFDPVNITETTVTLNWTENNDTDFDKYEVHVAREAGFEPNTSTLEDTVLQQNLTTYMVENLIPGITYMFKIRVLDEVGQFADSNEVLGKTLGNAPPEAVHLSVSDFGETEITLKWTKNNDSDFAKYEVHYSSDENFTIDPSNLWDDVTVQSSRISKVTGLESNTTYHFQVRVVDEFNLFNDSNRVNATTEGPNMPPKAVILGEPQNITRTSMELYWSESLDPDFGYYELHKSQSQGFDPTENTRILKFMGAEQTFHNVTGLKMEEEYYFIVRIKDNIGQHNDSNEVMGKTLPPNELPIADAGRDQTVLTSAKTKFEGVGVDPDGKIVNYQWDFESDGVWDFENPITGFTDHLYTQAGSYIATFKVTDNDGDTATDIANITVEEPPAPNQAPKANAGPDHDISEGDTVFFEGTGVDQDGSIVLYEWDYDGDGEYDDFSYDDGFGEYKYDDEGIYKAKLRVKDNLNATSMDVAIVRVEPKNTPPVARIDSPLDGRKYDNEEFIAFDGTKSYDEDDDSLTYEWTDSLISGILSTKKKFSKQLKLGRHAITLTVSDGKDTAEEEITITVEEPENEEPEVTISEPKRNSIIKGIVAISGKATDDDGIISEVCVKIDSGSCQKAQGTRNWFYEWDTKRVTNGPHTIKVIATDDRDGEDTASIIVTVKNPKDEEKGFFEGIPGFEAPMLFAAGAVVALAMTIRRRRRY